MSLNLPNGNTVNREFAREVVAKLHLLVKHSTCFGEIVDYCHRRVDHLSEGAKRAVRDVKLEVGTDGELPLNSSVAAVIRSATSYSSDGKRVLDMTLGRPIR